MITLCKTKKVPLIIYVPPLRNDVSPPYDPEAYRKFILKLNKDCKEANVLFLDLENLVPPKYWGVKEGTAIGVATELDFMHFQQAGHKLIADTIYKTIKKHWLSDDL